MNRTPKNKLLGMLFLLLCTCSLFSCNDDELSDKVETIHLYVSAETGTYTPWGSETPIECMLVKEAGEQEYSTLPFGGITGFDYVRRHTYELKVQKTTLANPPADGSRINYALLEIISDTPPATPEPPKPEELPEEAKFKLRMVQLNPFMNLDTQLAAPFDLLVFRIHNHQDQYIFLEKPEFLQYYDSIVMSSPVLPDTYCIYSHKKNASGSSTHFIGQWSSSFFEKSDFQVSLQGYKNNKVIYKHTITQLMRERDFLGVDWKNGSIAIANPTTWEISNCLDNRYCYLLTDTQETNKTPYIIIHLKTGPSISEAESLKMQKNGLQWLLKKHLGEASSHQPADFKTLPENVDLVETYENSTTLAALLHQHSDDFHLECYYIIAEAK